VAWSGDPRRSRPGPAAAPPRRAKRRIASVRAVGGGRWPPGGDSERRWVVRRCHPVSRRCAPGALRCAPGAPAGAARQGRVGGPVRVRRRCASGALFDRKGAGWGAVWARNRGFGALPGRVRCNSIAAMTPSPSLLPRPGRGTDTDRRYRRPAPGTMISYTLYQMYSKSQEKTVTSAPRSRPATGDSRNYCRTRRAGMTPCRVQPRRAGRVNAPAAATGRGGGVLRGSNA
jgi:hypothetical protein